MKETYNKYMFVDFSEYNQDHKEETRKNDMEKTLIEFAKWIGEERWAGIRYEELNPIIEGDQRGYFEFVPELMGEWVAYLCFKFKRQQLS